MRERELEGGSPGSATGREQAQTRQQDLQQSSSIADRTTELKNDTQHRMDEATGRLHDLQAERLQLTLDPTSDQKQLNALDDRIGRQQKESGRLEGRYADLDRLERLYPDLDDRGQKAARDLLKKLERDPDRGSPWTASLEAQGQAFQRPELQAMLNALDQQDPAQALTDVGFRLEALEQRGVETSQTAQIAQLLAQDLYANTAVNQLRDLLQEFEKQGVMRTVALEQNGQGLSIAEVPELKAVWDLAREDSTNYNAVRTEFWKLMNPDYRPPNLNDAEMAQVKAAREFIEAAGYTFEDSRPGNAPRLVADHPLSRNDYTLSLQHDFPQHLIKAGQGELEKLLTDPGNLRFATTRDNLQEDSVRFGKSGSWTGRLEARLEGLQDSLEQVAKLPELSQKDLKNVERALETLPAAIELERDALRETGAQYQSLSELRVRLAVEERKLENLTQASTEGGPELAQRESQIQELARGVTQLKAQDEMVRQKVSDNMQQLVQEFRELKQVLDYRIKNEEGWVSVRRQMEERVAELEAEYELLPKK